MFLPSPVYKRKSSGKEEDLDEEDISEYTTINDKIKLESVEEEKSSGNENPSKDSSS